MPSTQPTHIVKTAANHLFFVRETGNPDLSHVWHGIPAKRVQGGFRPRGTPKKIVLVRKVGCQLIAKVS